MQKKYIENRTKNLLTEFWSGKLPVNISKMVESLKKINVKKDMLFGSSGIVSVEAEGISCKINVMDSEEKHRFAMACAIGYLELNADDLENGFSFDVIKDYEEFKDKLLDESDNKIWQAVKFAHYLLMPEEAVKKEVENGKKQGIIPSFSYLYYSKEFKAPENVIEERFKELGVQ